MALMIFLKNFILSKYSRLNVACQKFSGLILVIAKPYQKNWNRGIPFGFIISQSAPNYTNKTIRKLYCRPWIKRSWNQSTRVIVEDNSIKELSYKKPFFRILSICDKIRNPLTISKEVRTWMLFLFATFVALCLESYRDFSSIAIFCSLMKPRSLFRDTMRPLMYHQATPPASATYLALERGKRGIETSNSHEKIIENKNYHVSNSLSKSRRIREVKVYVSPNLD